MTLVGVIAYWWTRAWSVPLIGGCRRGPCQSGRSGFAQGIRNDSARHRAFNPGTQGPDWSQTVGPFET